MKRIKQASVHYERARNGIHTETFPAISYDVINGVIHIDTPDGGTQLIPINDNLRKVEFKK